MNSIDVRAPWSSTNRTIRVRTKPADVSVCAVGECETVIGYVRVSTEEQGATGAGLEAQRAASASECARREHCQGRLFTWHFGGCEDLVLQDFQFRRSRRNCAPACTRGVSPRRPRRPRAPIIGERQLCRLPRSHHVEPH
jgi:hypothetical protein